MQIRILALLVLALFVACGSSLDATGPPPTPQLPRDFQWEGRWIVSDLGVNVAFTWQGKDGNVQMIAGSEGEAIHFTNLIYDGFLYTLTYKWPDVVPPNTPECLCLGQFTLDELNLCLDSSRYVGAEILEETEPRSVHHFRIGVVLEFEPPPDPFRVPIMEGDFYVDQEDSTKFWKVLHFGFQNLLDPALDEWAVMQKVNDTPGEVTFPAECRIVKCPPIPLTADNCK